jgi:hypothetical protein
MLTKNPNDRIDTDGLVNFLDLNFKEIGSVNGDAYFYQNQNENLSIRKNETISKEGNKK